jgi:hypothetical protein
MQVIGKRWGNTVKTLTKNEDLVKILAMTGSSSRYKGTCDEVKYLPK